MHDLMEQAKRLLAAAGIAIVAIASNDPEQYLDDEPEVDAQKK